MESQLPVFVSEIAAKLQRFAEMNPSATEKDLAAHVVDDVDRLAVDVFELAA